MHKTFSDGIYESREEGHPKQGAPDSRNQGNVLNAQSDIVDKHKAQEVQKQTYGNGFFPYFQTSL